MSDIRVYPAITPNRTTGVSPVGVHGTRSGELYVANWFDAVAMEGRMFVANGGSATTPITFGAGTIDTTEPDLFVSVPSSALVLPVSIRTHMEAYGTAAIFEYMASTGTGGSAGTDTDVTPTNLRSDAPVTSTCTIGVASNADATYMTANVSEFWRGGIQEVATIASADDASPVTGSSWEWDRFQVGTGPIMNGSSQLMAFFASQASTGFIVFTYAELPSEMVI